MSEQLRGPFAHATPAGFIGHNTDRCGLALLVLVIGAVWLVVAHRRKASG